MSNFYFENLPSTNTPITAENINKLNNVIVSDTQPSEDTPETVWLKTSGNKGIYTKNADGQFVEFSTVPTDIVVKGDFAVITADITTPASGESVINAVARVGYPTGFTAENSVVVSLMSQNLAFSVSYWNTVGISNSASSMGNYGLQATLRDSEIQIEVRKINTSEASKNIRLKVVLMKTN